MSGRTHQETFYTAVQDGKQGEWCGLLVASKQAGNVTLDLGLCLLDAVRLGAPLAVKDVLQLRPSLQAEDSEGQRAIHLAARLGPPETIQLLARAGSTLNGSDRAGWTPLHIACQCGQLSLVDTLLSLHANGNAGRTEDCLTPLHIAVQSQNTDIISALLQHGANPNIKSSAKHGRLSAVAMAVMAEDLNTLDVIFKNSTVDLEYSEDENGVYPLHLAIENGNVEVFEYLLSHIGSMKLTVSTLIRVSGSVNLALQRQASYQVAARRQMLLDVCNREEQTALHLAILYNRTTMVRLLLEAGADPSIAYKDVHPLELATKCIQPFNSHDFLSIDCPEREKYLKEGIQWDDSIVRLLFERAASFVTVFQNGKYAIHLALSAGLYEFALVVMAEMPDLIDCTDSTDQTPLHICCERKAANPSTRLTVITKLLDMGLSINATNKDGTCPLTLAVKARALDVISTLLAYSPDMNVRDRWGYAPLHYAVYDENVDVLDALFEARPEIINFDRGGPSPLYVAVTERKLNMVKYLLDRGADPNHTWSAMEPPLHTSICYFTMTATSQESLDIIKLLVMKGANLETHARGMTPLQDMLQVLVCCSMLPGNQESSKAVRLAAVKYLVEAGCRLHPWTLTNVGMFRRTPLQIMAFCGLLPAAYYLTNVGWPLHTEIARSTPNVDANWVHLPGNTISQDNLHAYLMLRHANPFSLLHLARTAVRTTLMDVNSAKYGGERRQILTAIEDLPVPDSVKQYLRFQDWDYSSAEASWNKLAHLLPEGVAVEALRAAESS